MRNWKAEHPGQDPDVMTTQQLIAQAEHDSREAVLTEELYSRVPEITRDPDRWRTSMVEIPPSETVAPQPDQRFRCLASR